MHYTGMAAMRMQAHLSYDAFFVTLSVLIAIGASIVALWLAFLEHRAASEAHRLGRHGTRDLGHALHGDGRGGLPCALGCRRGRAPSSIGQTQLALAVAAATFLILFLALVAAIFDRRFALLASREAAALRESERRFRLLIESVSDYAIFMLDPAGRVTSWNGGAQRVHGYTADEIIGAHVSVFYGREEHGDDATEQALKTAREQGKFESEGWHVRKDGSRFWASAIINRIDDETGQCRGFAKIIRDVTERREAQQQLAQAQAKLVQSQKMEAIGQLTGGVAHDFNNLLAVVLGNLELLRKRLPDDPQLAAGRERATRRRSAAPP